MSYKKLFNNSIIFGIGDIGSKGITFLLIPMYTFYLTQIEFGYIDLIQVSINLLIPVVSLSIYEAVLRYVMDNRNKSIIFTNGFFVTIISTVLILLITIILQIFVKIPYILLVTIILILHLFQMLFSQFIRGIGYVKVFALNGIIFAFTTAIMNVILIAYFKLGITGYLWSIVLGLISSLMYMNLKVNIMGYIRLKYINKIVIKGLLIYSVPLMPNSIIWWIINASSRYFILIFVGASYNGLFAVASKIPSVLSIFNSIFFKAWQLSAIEEYNTLDKDSFYSDVFYYYQQFLFIVMGFIFLFLKPIFEIAIGDSFFTAWKYVPFLLVAVLFSSFSSFLGTNYIASKETAGVFKSSLIGGIINIIFNLITIPIMGVFGAGLASMISFITMTVIRMYDTKKYVDINYKYKNFLLNIFLLSINVSIMFLKVDVRKEMLFHLVILLFILTINRHILNSIFKKIRIRV